MGIKVKKQGPNVNVNKKIAIYECPISYAYCITIVNREISILPFIWLLPAQR